MTGSQKATALRLCLPGLLASPPSPRDPWSRLLGEYWIPGKQNQRQAWETRGRHRKPAPWYGAQRSRAQGSGPPLLRKKGPWPQEKRPNHQSEGRDWASPVPTPTHFRNSFPSPEGKARSPLGPTSGLSFRPASPVSYPLLTILEQSPAQTTSQLSYPPCVPIFPGDPLSWPRSIPPPSPSALGHTERNQTDRCPGTPHIPHFPIPGSPILCALLYGLPLCSRGNLPSFYPEGLLTCTGKSGTRG